MMGIILQKKESPDDIITRLNGYAFAHDYQKFFMYLKKPVANKEIFRIGYCFDLAALGLIMMDNQKIIRVWSPVTARQATTVDMTNALSWCLPALNDGSSLMEFPYKCDVCYDYTAFTREVQLVFVELDEA